MQLSCAATCSVSAGTSTDACVDNKTQLRRQVVGVVSALCFLDRYRSISVITFFSRLTELGHSHLLVFFLDLEIGHHQILILGSHMDMPGCLNQNFSFQVKLDRLEQVALWFG
jgi:hypothetical protein